MKNCPNGHSIPNEALFCPYDGYSFALQTSGVSILPPTFPSQGDNFLLYFQEKNLFRGYIKPDGSTTIGKSPFGEDELGSAIGFSSLEAAIAWAEVNGFNVKEKEKLVKEYQSKSKDIRRIAGGLIQVFVGLMGIGYAIAVIGFVPEQAFSALLFGGLGIFLVYNGIKQFTKNNH
jgi:hypothetical protein